MCLVSAIRIWSERTWAVSARGEGAPYTQRVVDRGQEDMSSDFLFGREFSSVVLRCPLLRSVPPAAVLMCTDRDDGRQWQQWAMYLKVFIEKIRVCDAFMGQSSHHTE